MVALVTPFEPLYPVVDLIEDGNSRALPAWAETSIVAKVASTQGNGTIYIRARKTAVNADFLNSPTKETG